MSCKRYSPEEIIHKLREAEVLLGQGQHSGRSSSPIGDSRANLLSLAKRLWRPGSRLALRPGARASTRT
jgi:hypothetical protein